MSQASSTGSSFSVGIPSTLEFNFEDGFTNFGLIIIRPGYGKDVDPTLIIPSYTRPIREPAALEYI